ncbi:hypothetical protein ABAC460_00895 [Asticcacaulis sp. AC460]|uniref:hypothetical protein n=1 Tax=Asticcacaulis sp. AC460 TaxID=1282360 RepID=UPI0003C3EF52|nr:hypothetical protein [Asticcacaulis sp. AC460]ESQ93290.1 hypothetical protein ABAC460_00895 [Asticcacaulis sp. AC460]
MRMVKWLILATALVAPFAGPAGAQTLWREAVRGDSMAATQKKFPAAKVGPSNPEKKVTILDLSGIDVESYPSEARFFFKDGALYSIFLNIEAKPSMAVNEVRSQLLKGVLTSQYGQPTECGDISPYPDVSVLYKCKWIADNLLVMLTWSQSHNENSANTPYITIGYEPRS